jgi:hypothetical protein
MAASGPVRQVAPDRVEIREGGGCLSLFGLPFLLAGLFLVLVALRIVPMGNAQQVPAWGWPLFFLMGVIFTAVGGGLVFGRRWILLDAGRGTIRKQWGLLVPMKGAEHRLGDYDAVLLRFEAGDSDTADRYPVLLRGAGGAADLTLSSSTQYGESYEGAAAVARLMRAPLVDAATDHEVVIAADRLDESFRERLAAGEPGRDLEAARPLRMQCRLRETSRSVEIEIPGPGFRYGSLVGCLVSAGLLAYFAPSLLEFFQRTRTPEGVQAVIFGVAALLMVVFPLLGVINAAALAALGRTLVTASPEGLLIEVRGAWRARTTRIPAADILGLDFGSTGAALASARRSAERRVAEAGRQIPPSLSRDGAVLRWMSRLARLVPSKGVIVKSRTDLVTFGAGLPDEEVRYLYAVVARALGGGQSRW